MDDMSVEVLFFARAREIAGKDTYYSEKLTLDSLVEELCMSFGPDMASILTISRLWVNQDPAKEGQILRSGDRVAVLPPVSGG